MFNFKMDAGDIVLDGQNNIALVYDDDELVQNIQETLTTNVGEWFLNEEQGLKRYEILGQKFNYDDATDLISEAIFQHEQVDQIENINIFFDKVSRKMEVHFEIIKKNGETIEGEVKI